MYVYAYHYCVYSYGHAGHLTKGTLPPAYLVDGLREIRYSLNSWIRTKEVGLHGSNTVCVCIYVQSVFVIQPFMALVFVVKPKLHCFLRG